MHNISGYLAGSIISLAFCAWLMSQLARVIAQVMGG